MSLLEIEKLHDEATAYLDKYDELINTDKDKANEYLEKAKECQYKAGKLLGLIPENE